MEPIAYKQALVTGASSGLGRGLAKWLALRGCHVFAIARRTERLDELKAELPPGAIDAVALDVTDAGATLETVSRIDEESRGLDLVVANAGVGGQIDVAKPDWKVLERIIAANVTGASATLMAAAPGMVRRGHGHLVGVSSVASFRGLPGNGGYCGSKAYLAVFLEGLRLDLKRHGVKVTAIHPGFVKSEMTAKNRFKMPFLLETDDAVNRMGRAIVRGARTYVFPWQMKLLINTARALPDALYDAVGPALGK
jgi:short-subunit dehydrogenase